MARWRENIMPLTRSHASVHTKQAIEDCETGNRFGVIEFDTSRPDRTHEMAVIDTMGSQRSGTLDRRSRAQYQVYEGLGLRHQAETFGSDLISVSDTCHEAAFLSANPNGFKLVDWTGGL